IIAIQSCDLFIYTGGESDSWIEDILSSMENPPAVFRLVDAVEVIHSVHDHEEVSLSSHIEFDEHVWTSPVNAMEIVNALSVTITTLDSENSRAYRKNTSEYLGKLEELHDSFIEVTEKAENKTIIMGDRFPFRYLAHEYNLDYMAAFPGCSADSEPGAKTVSQLIEKIKTDNIPVVFHIEFSNKKTAEAISEATGAEIRLLHSCHNVTQEQLENNITYIDLMEQNLTNLKEALL
ncbi:MAG: zinc ABC transporter substrate-binding protein, partial [Clostridia bacterium]|nr:zinc ABC transporter substrate-binding protein [Clostridia bacterium]